MSAGRAGDTEDPSTWPSPQWRRAFELAWESYAAGSLGVGALVLDAGGAAISEGRNRAFDADDVPQQLSGSYLAHAELNALAPLGREASHRDLTMITTLEPCLLCMGAIVLADIGRLEFAAADTLWRGIDRLPGLNGFVASRWPQRVGPLAGRPGVLGAVLTLAWFIRARPGGTVESEATRANPRLVDLARRLAADSTARSMPFQDFLTAYGPDLDRCPPTPVTPGLRVQDDVR